MTDATTFEMTEIAKAVEGEAIDAKAEVKTGEFDKVACAVCGYTAHFLEPHLQAEHNMTVKQYLADYPTAKVVSAAGQKALNEFNENPMVDGSIKKLFGIGISKNIKTVPMFQKPQASTPAIDPAYVFDKENLLLMVKAIVDPTEKVLFTGPTGSGKSSIIEQVAARLNWGFTRIACDGDQTRADLIGQWTLVDGKTVFQYGLIPLAMMNGHILDIDEWDAMNPSVGMALQSVLEGKPLTITETGEVITPAWTFRIFATSNTIGQGDATGLYNGTQPQNFAQLDRFTLVQIVDYPDKANEAKIIENVTGIDDSMILDKLIEVANLVRSAHKKGDCVATMSTRTIINVAKKLLDFGDVRMAYKLTFVNKLNDDDSVLVRELLQRVWGKEAA